jgi:ArsR family transcriptional regulator
MVIHMKAVALTSDAAEMVRVHAALGNPTRFRILEILSRNPESIVADIVGELPIAQSTVSQHLAVLKDAGLIYGEDTASGGCCCRIDANALRTFAQWVVGWSHELVAAAGCPAPKEEDA